MEKSLQWGGGISYIKRLILFMIFWTVVQFPVVIYSHGYLHMGLRDVLKNVLIDLFFRGTFHGSWFIVALIIGVPIVSLLYNYLGRWGTMVIATVVSAYFYHYPELTTPYGNVGFWVADNIHEPLNTFFVSLIWIALGLVFAHNNMRCITQKVKLKYLFCFLMVLWSMSMAFGWNIRLGAVCVMFLIACNYSGEYKEYHKMLRQMSILIFILHFVFIMLFRHLLSKMEVFQHGIVLFLVVLCLSIISSKVILVLKDKYKWLKYSV